MSYQLTLPIGSSVNGEYQILRVLGSGGFANTYLARDLSLQRNVAIKEYFPREIAARTNGVSVSAKSNQLMRDYLWGLQRFTQEAKIIARFKHPNVVRVFRVIDAHNTAYIILEYVDGADMEVWLKRHRNEVQQAQLDGMLPGLLEALDLTHGEGVLHRDIKPANIYIRASDGTPVLLDFGASKLDFGEKTGTTAAIVSRGYSAQEADATDGRHQGPWTDIYGMAATLYYALTGRPPPEATERVLRDEIVPASRLAVQGFRPTFLGAIDWGLRVQPKERPQSVAQWLPALLHGVEAPAGIRGAPEKSGRTRSILGRVTSKVRGQPPATTRSWLPPTLEHATNRRPPPAPSRTLGPQYHPAPASVPQPRHVATHVSAPPVAERGNSRPVSHTPLVRRPDPTRRPRLRLFLAAIALSAVCLGLWWGRDLFARHGFASAIWSPSERGRAANRPADRGFFNVYAPRAPDVGSYERSRSPVSEEPRPRMGRSDESSRSAPARTSEEAPRARSRPASDTPHPSRSAVDIPQ